jgi:WD40 repeat protein
MERLIRTFQGTNHEPISCIAVSTDGRHLLSATRLGSDGVQLWRVDSGQVVHTFSLDENDAVEAVAFSPDRFFAAAATSRQNVIMWDMETRAVVGAVASLDPSGGLGIAFAADRSFILAAHGRRYTRYDLSLKVQQEHDNLQRGRIFSPALSRNGRSVASLHTSPNVLVIYDLLTDKPSLTLPDPPAGGATAVAFSADDSALLIGRLKGSVGLLSASSGDLVRDFALPGHAKLVTSVAVSPDGRLALSGSEDNTVKVWEVATGTLLETLTHGGGFVNCVAFSPDSRSAFSGGNDKTVKLWDVSGLIG